MNKRATLFGKYARSVILNGIKSVSAAVSVTLGAGGKEVVIESSNPEEDPVITKDGVTVAEEFNNPNPQEAQGSKLAVQVARQANEVAGDGTTTATILTKAVSQEVVAAIDNIGGNATSVQRGVDAAAADAIKAIEEISHDVDEERLVDIASVSANNNRKVGEIVGKAVWKAGKDGIVLLVPTVKYETTVEESGGMLLQSPLASVAMTNALDTQSEHKESVRIGGSSRVIVTDFKFDKPEQAMDILKAAKQAGEPVLLICRQVYDNVLPTFVSAYLAKEENQKIDIAVVYAPNLGSSEAMYDILEDVAIATGGRFFSTAKGDSTKTVKSNWSQNGLVEGYVASSSQTKLMGGMADKGLYDERKKHIMDMLSGETDPMRKDAIRERLANFSSNVIKINVGGRSQAELRSKMDKFEDAKRACFAALEKGYVTGGGIAYLYAYYKNMDKIHRFDDDAFIDGYESMTMGLLEPFYQNLINAGIDNPDTLDQMREDIVEHFKKGETDFGVNVMKGEIVNMHEDGIIDPTKVCTTCIQKSSSIAGMVALTEVVMYDDVRYKGYMKDEIYIRNNTPKNPEEEKMEEVEEELSYLSEMFTELINENKRLKSRNLWQRIVNK